METIQNYSGYLAVLIALWPLWAKIWSAVKTYLSGSAKNTETKLDDQILEKMNEAEKLKARVLENEFLTVAVPGIYAELERQYKAGTLPLKGLGKMIQLINSVKSIFQAKTGLELSPDGVKQAESLAESLNKVQKVLENPQPTPVSQ